MTTEEAFQELEKWQDNRSDRVYRIEPQGVSLTQHTNAGRYRENMQIAVYRREAPFPGANTPDFRFLGVSATIADCVIKALKRWQEKYGEEVQS